MDAKGKRWYFYRSRKLSCNIIASHVARQMEILIIYEMCIKSPIRFGELRKNIDGITNTMLTSSLRELEKDGLVLRIQFNEIPLM